MNFFDIIENLCKQHNTKVTNVLKEIGLSRSKGTAWRNGSIPNGEILVKLAEYFNVSIDYLLGYAPKVDDEEQEYIKFFASLSPAERKLAYKIAVTSIIAMRNALEKNKEEK